MESLCICVCVCISCLLMVCTDVYLTYFLQHLASPCPFKPRSQSWGQNLKKQVLLTFLAVALLFSLSLLCSRLSPSFLLAQHFISPFSIASYFLPFLFTFPWTKPLGSFPEICFCLPTLGECNVKTFFMKLGETLQLQWSSMVCTFCGSLNT